LLANQKNLNELIARFSKAHSIAADAEAYGLHPYNGDRLFSIIIADEEGAVYFNFKPYPEAPDDAVLPDPSVLAPIFKDEGKLVFMHNAKYDLAMLRFDGIEVERTVHCTQAIARLVYNKHFQYNLDALAKEIGLEKNKVVEEYISKHKLFDMVQIPGKQKKVRNEHYDKVPFDVIVPYGLDDAKITRALGLSQIARIEAMAATMPKNIGDVRELMRRERELTKVCFNMEWRGALIDPAYVKEALEYELNEQKKAEDEFKKLTGHDFKDSPKALGKAFDAIGEPYPHHPPTALMVKKARAQGKTPVGNPCFKAEALAGMETPAAKLVLAQRSANKKAGTYYRSFLYFSDDSNYLHCDLRQAGTDTGRMSSAEPNLQNLPKREEENESLKYRVRRAFPPPKDYVLVMIDYDQMEYRLMLNYAAEMGLIEKIKGGLDVHQATADMMHVDRYPAKTLNFMIIYGGGIRALARKLKCSYDQAAEYMRNYKNGLPNCWRFIKRVIYTAEKRGFIFNWAGRRYEFDNPEFAYKAPNYLIQGGCADIVKKAMVECEHCLKGRKSTLRLQVHDECFFYIHKNEFNLVPELKGIMENTYIPKYLPLTCGVDHSFVSWGDKISEAPGVKNGGAHGAH